MFGYLRMLLAILIVGLSGMGLCLGQDRGPAPIRVLVVTGGHAFDPSFFELFQDHADIQWEHREHTGKTSDAYSVPVAESWDVVVLYDMVQHITESEKTNFLELFEKGKGLVVLHHALASYQQWPLFEEIIGGRYYASAMPELPDGVRLEEGRLVVEFSDIAQLPQRLAEVARTAKEYFEATKNAPAPSTFQHDVRFNLMVVDSPHPVLAGVRSFTILDEIYGRMEAHDNIHPLLVTDQPQSTPIVAWAKAYRDSRVVTIQPGHGPPAFQNPQFRQLIVNAIRWSANQ